jgi:hypothetical protein
MINNLQGSVHISRIIYLSDTSSSTGVLGGAIPLLALLGGGASIFGSPAFNKL